MLRIWTGTIKIKLVLGNVNVTLKQTECLRMRGENQARKINFRGNQRDQLKGLYQFLILMLHLPVMHFSVF